MPITQGDKKEWQAKKNIRYENERLANRYRVFERDISKFLICPVCKKVFDKYAESYSHIELVHQQIVQPREIGEDNDSDVEEIFVEPNVEPQNDQEIPPARQNEKVFQCGFCQKIVSDKTALSRHKKIHTGKKTHICPQCSKAFFRKDELKQHSVVHLSPVF